MSTKLSQEKLEKLVEYKKKVQANLSVLIDQIFPEKILELTELLESDQFSIDRVDTIHTPLDVRPLLPASGGYESAGATSSGPPGVNDLTKRFLEWNFLHMSLPPEGIVRSNTQLDQLICDVTKLQFQFLKQTAQLKTAVQFYVPKVEDGNNFGVEIQEEAVKMLSEMEKEHTDRWSYFSGGFSSYYKDRGSLANDVCKEPHVDDYRQGLRQHDVKTFLLIVHVVTHLRDAYAKIHDVITKNREKIMTPRTSNADSLSN